MLFTSVAGLVAVVYGITGVSSTSTPPPELSEFIDWDFYINKGWTCLTPPTRSQPGRSGSFGNNVCPNQVSTCQAYCSTRGGTVRWENACFSNNEGSDSPFQSITYCFICRCMDNKTTTPDLTAYYGSVERNVCEREEQNCYYAYNQYAQSPPEGKCKVCPEGQYVAVASGAPLNPITSLSFATATPGVSRESTSSTTTTRAPVVTEDGSDLWNGLEPEGWGPETRTTSIAMGPPAVQPTSESGVIQPPDWVEVVQVDSGALKQAAGVMAAVLAVAMAL
ncbi:hypothetical protein QBC41DRAFT_345649 [Cercophora samala]|uniref:Uncharacterized protein n=1 Tax=Cercophora samala TaxID=330535 RepID=A0AA40DDN8_9PEZI|nr:hypothetical protein QBC41DRAFT_345649 [Cercophora samala]